MSSSNNVITVGGGGIANSSKKTCFCYALLGSHIVKYNMTEQIIYDIILDHITRGGGDGTRPVRVGSTRSCWSAPGPQTQDSAD